MSFTTVISCPSCLNQFKIDPSLDGKRARCPCRAEFSISATRPSPGGDEPILLGDPIAPRFAYFREGCKEFIGTASSLLTLAGKPVTKAGIVKILESAPRDEAELGTDEWRGEFCSRMLERAYMRLEPVGIGELTGRGERYEEAFAYFIHRFPCMPRDSLYMLEGAVLGVLGAFEAQDSPESQAAALPPPRKQGLLGPLAWKRARR